MRTYLLCTGFLLLAVLLLTPALLPNSAQARLHDFVLGKSEILVRTDRGGLLSFAGHRHVIRAERFTGTLHLSDDPDSTRISLTIEAGSLVVIDDDLDPEDVAKVQKEMEENVLEVASHPEIGFVSSSARWQEREEVEVTGELSLHGATRPISFPMKVSREPDRLFLTGEVELKQKDFGIEPVSAGLGAVKVKNEVKISFELVAVPRLRDDSPVEPLDR
jgi:polyisoprenoid-binding protein YceI